MASGASDQPELSATSRHVLEALKRYCSLAWPILKTQCRLLGFDAAALAPSDVERVVPQIADALGRFTSDTKARAFRDELLGAPRGSSAPPRAGFRLDVRRSPELGEFARRVCDVLQGWSPLGWPLFEAQCQHAGVDPNRVGRAELNDLIPQIRRALVRFSSEASADVVVAQLRRLANEDPG